LRPDAAQVLAHPGDDTDFESGVAYVGKQHPRILIIGSGAGQEVMDGLHYGASSITAVEINPIINDVVTHRMRDYWAPVFARLEVRLVTEEGRSFVRRSHEKYDAIISVHTISNAAMLPARSVWLRIMC
jgi:spermidine synthase